MSRQAGGRSHVSPAGWNWKRSTEECVVTPELIGLNGRGCRCRGNTGSGVEPEKARFPLAGVEQCLDGMGC